MNLYFKHGLGLTCSAKNNKFFSCKTQAWCTYVHILKQFHWLIFYNVGKICAMQSRQKWWLDHHYYRHLTITTCCSTSTLYYLITINLELYKLQPRVTHNPVIGVKFRYLCQFSITHKFTDLLN